MLGFGQILGAAPVEAKVETMVVLEKHGQSGTETSSRNSGVIHAGLYYPPGSLKAVCCVEGRQLLYELGDLFGFVAGCVVLDKSTAGLGTPFGIAAVDQFAHAFQVTRALSQPQLGPTQVVSGFVTVG